MKPSTELRRELLKLLATQDLSSENVTSIIAGLEKMFPGMIEQSREAGRRKNQMQRMTAFVATIAELARTEQTIPSGDAQERNDALRRIFLHATNLVEEAVILFEAGRYSRAGFLCITAVEETGKCAVARMQVVSGVPRSGKPFAQGKRGQLMNHRRKYLLAACAGAVINRRMDELFGIDAVNQFISDCEKGNLAKERESLLYYSYDGQLHIPDREVDPERVRFLIKVAAELLAEGGTQDYFDWQTLLRWAEETREKVDRIEVATVSDGP